MYGCESWTIKKAEHWRIDTFEMWCWRRLLRVTWTARTSDQSILKEINPEYSLEGLTLKLQCFGHLMQRADSLEKTQMLGKFEDKRRKGQQMEKGGWVCWMTSLTQWTSGQLLSHVWLFTTPWTAACQSTLSFTMSWNLLKLMSIESMMPFNSSPPLSSPSPPALNLTQHQGVFQWVGSSHQVAKVLKF